MADAIHTVRFEPLGIEMDVHEGETVLDAAFRQGIALVHGCKEGQCSACKSRLLDGDVEMLKYSTFALPESERDSEHILLCRSHAYSDLTIELLNYDEELLGRSIAVRHFDATLQQVERLTHDIRLLRLKLDAPLKFWAGQYVDITLPLCGTTRSFSMANAPEGGTELDFIIKKYPDGRFSTKLDEELIPGAALRVKGPYGTCFHREGRSGPLVLLGGGSGMSPLLSILGSHVASGDRRPVRFFYGARTRGDLFHLDEIAALGARLDDFRFMPALSAEDGEGWNGERGFVHEVLRRHLADEALGGEIDAYCCGPPPMIDAAVPVLRMAGVEPEHIHCDKFTQATS